jgi:hypothetical protein
MTNLEWAFDRLHADETELADFLERMAERHRPEHEVHHVAGDLAGWSRDHLRTLVAEAGRLDLELDSTEGSGLVKQAKAKAAALLMSHPDPSRQLLDDLREAHLRAVAVSLGWEMLGQAAQAMKDPDLLAAVDSCHPQTLRQMSWTNGLIKQNSPQILTSS